MVCWLVQLLVGSTTGRPNHWMAYQFNIATFPRFCPVNHRQASYECKVCANIDANCIFITTQSQDFSIKELSLQ
ncbi:hypothetical protein SAMN04488491_0024 [Psychrobacter sp. LV10R520-6]|nr:hypothetical protein SAMN04488491_0024 [Psychrobacter sp. LV10R520-6]